MIKSYLTNCELRVIIDYIRNNWQYTVRGVPHGSKAGFRIFNIFLNDMFHFIDALSQTIIYTDDNRFAKIGYDIKVIKAEFGAASGVYGHFHES